MCPCIPRQRGQGQLESGRVGGGPEAGWSNHWVSQGSLPGGGRNRASLGSKAGNKEAWVSPGHCGRAMTVHLCLSGTPERLIRADLYFLKPHKKLVGVLGGGEGDLNKPGE